MSKLSWHFQRRPSQVVDIVNGSACEWVKLIDPPEGSNPFPNKKVVGRIWIGGDGVEGEYVRQGAMGATAYLEHNKDGARLLDYMLRRPYVTAWEGPNEPHPLSKIWFRKALAEFESQRCDLMHLNRLPIAVWGFSVGWLDDPRHILRFRESAEKADYAHLHEYSAPRMRAAEGWHCLRYRSSYQWLKNEGIRQPPLLITECGIDGGAHHIESEKRGGKGWKTYVSEDEYMADLAWYDSELCKDKYVEAAFVFTAGPESSWHDFEVTASLSRKMAMHTHEYPHEEEPPMEPEELIKRLMLMAESSVIPMVPGHALFDAIEADDRMPCSREGRTQLDGERWAWQWGYDSAQNTRWFYVCKEGDWGNILKAERPN